MEMKFSCWASMTILKTISVNKSYGNEVQLLCQYDYFKTISVDKSYGNEVQLLCQYDYFKNY